MLPTTRTLAPYQTCTATCWLVVVSSPTCYGDTLAVCLATLVRTILSWWLHNGPMVAVKLWSPWPGDRKRARAARRVTRCHSQLERQDLTNAGS